MSQPDVTLDIGKDYPELRDSVRRICEKYPMEYWAKLEEESGYPSAFVAELTESGFLAALPSGFACATDNCRTILAGRLDRAAVAASAPVNSRSRPSM